MHISGKIAAFLIILLGGAAFVLSTQLLDFQTSWLKEVDSSRKQLLTARETTAKKRKELAQLQADYDRLMLGWDTYINNVTASGDPATGTLLLNIGPPLVVEKKDESGNPVQPVVYAFQPTADGQNFEYVGEFRAERLAAGSSSFKANWRVRPEDAASWRFGSNWRIRTRIPSSDKLKFDQMSILLSDVDERYKYATNELQRSREEFAQKIKQAQANRENELQGFAAYEGDRGKLDDELIDGVLKTIISVEEARNAALAKSDRLRHDLQETVEQFEKISSTNSKATAELPTADESNATASIKP